MATENQDDYSVDSTTGEPIYKFKKQGYSHFQSLTESLNAAVFILKDWKIQWCSDYTEHQFKHTAKALCGTPFDALFKTNDDFKKIISEFQNEGKEKAARTFTIELTTSEPKIFSAEITISHIFKDGEPTGELLAVVKALPELDDGEQTPFAMFNPNQVLNTDRYLNADIVENIASSYQEAQAELQAIDEKYSNLVNRTRDGIVIIQDHLIRYTNPRFAEMLGYSQTELQGRGFIDLIPSQSIPQMNGVNPPGDEYTSIGSIHESNLLTKELKSLPVEIDTCAVCYDGKMADMVIVRDISGQKSMEEQILQKNKDLMEWQRRVLEATSLKARFLSNMSSELRSPLNSILGFTERILEGFEGSLTVSQRESLSKVQKNTHHLLNLINDILDLTKIQSGRMEFRPETFDIRSVLSDLLNSTQPELSEKGLKLEYEHPEKFPEIYGDPAKIQQVMENLLSNSIKFTKSGSVGIVMEDLSYEGFIRVMVWDTGTGIPEEDKSIIFDEFREIDSQQIRKFGGTGLGLAISKYIVEIHGGHIWIEDNTDAGTRVYFTLPKYQKGFVPEVTVKSHSVDDSEIEVLETVPATGRSEDTEPQHTETGTTASEDEGSWLLKMAAGIKMKPKGTSK
jgi:PAS domain S-box-containing protein